MCYIKFSNGVGCSTGNGEQLGGQIKMKIINVIDIKESIKVINSLNDDDDGPYGNEWSQGYLL